MRKLMSGIIALATMCATMCAAAVTVRPEATGEALINPDMGFVYYKYSNRLWAYGINTPENDTNKHNKERNTKNETVENRSALGGRGDCGNVLRG